MINAELVELLKTEVFEGGGNPPVRMVFIASGDHCDSATVFDLLIPLDTLKEAVAQAELVKTCTEWLPEVEE